MKLRSLAATLARAIAVSLLVAIALVPAAVAKSKFKILHEFAGGNDGGVPVLFAGLAIDKSGNLYGAGLIGGTQQNCPGSDGSGCGVIFEMVHGASGKWSETVPYNFPGKNADSPLAIDSQGNVYGCIDDGPMFELTPGAGQWTFNSIWQYGCDGPVGLILDGLGNLYGGFGNDSSGGVSELSPKSDGWVYTDLYEFCQQKGCPDGETPLAPFSWDVKGNLYGTTYSGGLVNYPDCGGWCGVAFQMTPNGDGTWTYHVMHRFGSFHGDGCVPYGGLMVDASGNAYGTTTGCGPNHTGTVFKLTPTKDNHWKETLLYSFPNINTGAAPGGNLVFDKAGNLYGAAGSSNCNYTCGLVFKLSPRKNGKWSCGVLHNFKQTDGNYPNGLTIDSDGNLYGTTSLGGKYGYGVVFEVTP
jgi:uncharacterized repeat protein (TIGR03803 family)